MVQSLCVFEMLADIAKLLYKKALSTYILISREWEFSQGILITSENVFICLMAICISSVNFLFMSFTAFSVN